MSELEIVTVHGPALVQDGGRPGLMHAGVPPGGALVLELLAIANHAARNSPGAAALELYGAIEVVAHGQLWLAHGGQPRELADGERLLVGRPESTRVSYLALRGGVDVPEVLGGRGTLLVAGLGGWRGRALRPGDRIPVGALPETTGVAPHPLDLDAPVRVVAGPDHERFPPEALSTLLESTFTISPASDRTGVRLQGPPCARLDDDRGLSTPMVRGAIQITAAGEPIVLGPDHPTIGGYPVLATVVRADLGALCARRPGAEMRFCLESR